MQWVKYSCFTSLYKSIYMYRDLGHFVWWLLPAPLSGSIGLGVTITICLYVSTSYTIIYNWNETTCFGSILLWLNIVFYVENLFCRFRKKRVGALNRYKSLIFHTYPALHTILVAIMNYCLNCPTSFLYGLMILLNLFSS